MKAKANILMLDRIDSLGIKFHSYCNIDIPDKVPVLVNFDEKKVIGFAEVTKGRCGLEADVTFFDDFTKSPFVELLIREEKLFLTGYYNRVKRQDNLIWSCNLYAVSIVYDDIYGDKSCLLREVTDESNNQD